VRFAKHLGVLYLQTQTGRLTKMGLIDVSSLEWNDPPADIESNCITLKENRKEFKGFALDDLSLGVKAMTGNLNLNLFLKMS